VAVPTPEYGNIIVDAESFSELINSATEFGSVGRNQQTQQILNNIIPGIFDSLAQLPLENIPSVLYTLDETLTQKDILTSFTNKRYQQVLEYNKWDGGIIDVSDADYLAVVSSDVLGDFKNSSVAQSIFKDARITEDGEIINTVVVQMQQTDGGDTTRYVRLYTPKGSELIEALGDRGERMEQLDYSGKNFRVDDDLAVSSETLQHDLKSNIEIFEESGKTVFGSWITLGAKETKLIYTYRLPFRLGYGIDENQLSFSFQKQPGVSSKLRFTVTLPEGKRIIRSEGNGFSGEFLGEFEDDKIFSMTIK